MAKRNQHSLDEIKAMVLSAAESIITEQGASSLTIRKIAMEIGYTVGSIYMVFASRAELIQAINARTQADIVAKLHPIDTIEAWLTAYLAYASTHQDLWRMMFLDTTYQIQLDDVFVQFARFFPDTPQQTTQALWLSIQGICLLSPDHDWQTALLALLAHASKQLK